MLQLRGAYRCPVTCGMAHIQSTTPAWDSLEGIVKQEKREEETNPLLPLERGKSRRNLHYVLHPGLS